MFFRIISLLAIATFLGAACPQARGVYNAERGRWLTRDPLGYVDGTSLCTYGISNPIRFSDAAGTDVPGCDVLPDNNTTAWGRCRLRCCAIHDRCLDCADCGWNYPCAIKCHRATLACLAKCEIFPNHNDGEFTCYCHKTHEFYDCPFDQQLGACLCGTWTKKKCDCSEGNGNPNTSDCPGCTPQQPLPQPLPDIPCRDQP